MQVAGRALLERSAPRARSAGFFFDFDGTLAPIQADPEIVVPTLGVAARLAELAGLVKRVAIVSARPIEFLRRRFEGLSGVALFGLYGLEMVGPDGRVRTDPTAAEFIPAVQALAERAAEEMPTGVRVEYKRLSLALHYRTTPERRDAVENWADERAAELGLFIERGRMVVELKPPVGHDKGTVIEQETGDLTCAWYFGDDLSDRRAFAVLTARAAGGDFVAVKVAVANAETGDELEAEADLIIPSPPAVPDFLAGVIAGLR